MALQIAGLNFSYGTEPVLRDINLSVKEGRFTVILGRNGCGKSTLLKLAAGMVNLQGGAISLLGRGRAQLTMRESARLLGYLPQFHQPSFPFTVEDVVLTGRASYVLSLPGLHDREKAYDAIKRVGIDHLVGRPYNELSGGERQLVMIARVLAQEPRLILLDEPVSHLDLANQTRVLRLMKDLVREGLTVLAVLHDPTAAFIYGDDFLFMKEGRIVCPTNGLSHYDSAFLSEVYGIDITVVMSDGIPLVLPGMGKSPA